MRGQVVVPVISFDEVHINVGFSTYGYECHTGSSLLIDCVVAASMAGEFSHTAKFRVETGTVLLTGNGDSVGILYLSDGLHITLSNYSLNNMR